MSCTSDTGITTLDKFCQLDHHVHRHNSNFTNITPDNQASSGYPSHPFFSISSSLPPVLKAAIKSTVGWLHWSYAEVGRWVTATNWTSLTPSDTSHGTPAPVSPLLVEPPSAPPSFTPKNLSSVSPTFPLESAGQSSFLTQRPYDSYTDAPSHDSPLPAEPFSDPPTLISRYSSPISSASPP